jgi:hypothetical protein
MERLICPEKMMIFGFLFQNGLGYVLLSLIMDDLLFILRKSKVNKIIDLIKENLS